METKVARTQRLTTFWKEWRSFLVFIGCIVFFRSAVADWSLVPTGSMEPTILVGDRIWVNKIAYDVRLPFSATHLKKLKDPQRGDIVVFPSPVDNIRLVKRIIGMPNDRIKMIDNKLYINGESLTYQPVQSIDAKSTVVPAYIEYLSPKAMYPIQLNEKRPSQYSNFPEVMVPMDCYLVLGDNRDNSGDSRVFGFIHRDQIMGQATNVFWSLDHDDYYLPRGDRFWHSLP